jgi:hypothetical protein
MKRFSVSTAGLVVLGVDNFVPGNPDCIRDQAFFPAQYLVESQDEVVVNV